MYDIPYYNCYLSGKDDPNALGSNEGSYGMLASIVGASKRHYCYTRGLCKIVVVCIWWYVDD